MLPLGPHHSHKAPLWPHPPPTATSLRTAPSVLRTQRRAALHHGERARRTHAVSPDPTAPRRSGLIGTVFVRKRSEIVYVSTLVSFSALALVDAGFASHRLDVSALLARPYRCPTIVVAPGFRPHERHSPPKDCVLSLGSPPAQGANHEQRL